MPLLDPPPETVAACPRCAERQLQRWLVDLERPRTAWSVCACCHWIAVWTDGRLEAPDGTPAADLPPAGAAAIAEAAEAERAEAAERLGALRAQLEVVLAQSNARESFLQQFHQYEQRLASGEYRDESNKP